MPASFALALLALDGVGRVTAHRVLERFPTLEAVRATPREQVLLRLKGAPHADRTVATLFDDDWSEPALAAARVEVDAAATRGITLLAPGDAWWPARLGDLDRGDRPVVLWAYGPLAALARPTLAVLGRPPIEAAPFEAAQAVARAAHARGASVAVGAASGVDLAVLKVAGAAIAVLNCGLARLAPSFRPGATALVRAGGVLLSPFPMEHGPFDHDDRERALVQAALAQAVVAAGVPEGSAEARAAAWALDTDRAVVALPPVPAALAGATASADDALGTL